MGENILYTSGQRVNTNVHANKQIDNGNTKTPIGTWIRDKIDH